MIVHAVRAAARVVGGGPQRLRAQPGHELRELGARVGREVAAAQRAQRLQRRAHGAEAGGEERVGVVGVDDRVEDQALDVLRIGARVGDRELGAVGDPEQRQLVDAELGPDRLHVLHRVRRRVVAAGDADPLRALRGGAGVAQLRVLLELAGSAAGRSGRCRAGRSRSAGRLSTRYGKLGSTLSISVNPAPPGPPERYISVLPEVLPTRPMRRLIVPGRRPCGRAGRSASRSGRRRSRRTNPSAARRWRRSGARERGHGEQRGENCSAEHAAAERSVSRRPRARERLVAGAGRVRRESGRASPTAPLERARLERTAASRGGAHPRAQPGDGDVRAERPLLGRVDPGRGQRAGDPRLEGARACRRGRRARPSGRARGAAGASTRVEREPRRRARRPRRRRSARSRRRRPAGASRGTRA